MDRTIMTVIIDSTGETKDLDLPSHVPLLELVDPILRGISQGAPQNYNLDQLDFLISDGSQQWQTVSGNSTLSELNVLEGYYLRLEKVQSFSTASETQDMMKNDKISLF